MGAVLNSIKISVLTDSSSKGFDIQIWGCIVVFLKKIKSSFKVNHMFLADLSSSVQ